MKAFCLSFVFASLFIASCVFLRLRFDEWKRTQREDELKRMAIWVWQGLPILLLSMILVLGAKTTVKNLTAKKGVYQETLSLVAFTKD